MLTNILGHKVRSRRHLIVGSCLLAAFIALPAFAVQNPTIKLSLNASFNGYTVENSDDGIEVRLVGVHEGTSKSSGILIGMHQVTVTLSNKKQLKKSLTFTDGNADFGTIDVEPNAGAKVNTVSVIAPMY